MKISQKVFWIFFTVILITLVMATFQTVTYYTQKRLNFAVTQINQLQSQVRQLEQLRLALFLPGENFDQKKFDHLVEASSQTSQELTESLVNPPVGAIDQLTSINLNLNNFRRSLLELAETRNLTKHIESSIHKTLLLLDIPKQINLEYQKAQEPGNWPDQDTVPDESSFTDFQLHLQVSSFVHHLQFQRLPRIKQAVAQIKTQEINPALSMKLDVLIQSLENYYLKNLQLEDRKQFVETSANNFLESTQLLLVKLEEASMLQQWRVSQLAVLISFLGMLAAIFYWYRIRIYIQRFLFNQKQVMLAIQDGSNNLQLVTESQDELGDLTAAMRDLSIELNKKKVALLESEKKYRLLIESLTDWVWETDVNRSFSFCNEAGEKITGYATEKMLGKKYLTLSEKYEKLEVIQLIENHFHNKTSFTNIERQISCADGSIKHVIASGTPLLDASGDFTGFRGIDRDITELVHARELHEQLEMELQHSQKMDSIGRLAGGVAHDFNNILSAIIGYSELAKLKLKPDHGCFHYITEIKKSGERAAGLTKQLLAFSRKQPRNPKSLNLADELRGLEDMLRRLVGELIVIQLDISEDVWPVYMDKSQFEQVVMNLTINAKDAMPAGGKINISLTNCSINDPHCDNDNVKMLTEDYVQLSVSDTGSGITNDVLQNIFDPFFSTKAQNKGTGLGLSTVYGIVTQNNGDVRVSSQIDKGSLFRVLMPRSTETLPEPTEQDVVQEFRTGSETILFVEDESILVQMHSTFLESLGYRLLIASNGLEALKVFEREDGIDLLITDVVMPKMGGIELAEELKKRKPQLKVLYTSGYADQDLFVNGILKEGFNFIYKPATPGEVVKMLEILLN